MDYLVELIIRPQRNKYNLKDLGDSAFSFSGQDFRRLDFNNGEIKNYREESLSCSLWCPLESNSRDISSSPLVIYCHGNAGNKIDIIEIFEFLLWEFNICSFDFSGAGFSEGDYVTLGYYEKYDIQAVVEFLRKELGVKNIILYGRSMGAVSSLLYSEMDPNLKACILDSPFCNFPKLCEEILSNKFFIPSLMSNLLIDSARKRILEKVEDFDINNFKPAITSRNVKVPTLLIHGKEDELVHISHSREIYQNINKHTHKILLEVDGMHNDTRPAKSINTIRDFMIQYSYDALIVKEQRRRLYIKNAQINYNAKHRIDINSIVESFRSHQEHESILEKNRKSFNYSENMQKIFEKKNSITSDSSSNNKKTKEVTFSKCLANEYQSEFKKENRRLNNFKIDINYNTNANDCNKILINARNKNIIRSKSLENVRKIQLDNNNNVITNILFDSTKIISNDQENNFLRKRNNSFTTSKNIKFHANTLFNEDLKELLNSNQINLNFKSTKLLENPNLKKNTITENFSKIELNSDCYNKNNNFNKRNSMVVDSNPNKAFEETYPAKKSYLRSSYTMFNEKEEKNASKNPIDFDVSHRNIDSDLNSNKTFNDYDLDKGNNFEFDNTTIDDRNNYTDINVNKIPNNNRGGRIKSRRNQVLSGIFNCDVKLGSSQIKITDLDKSSLRKRKNSIKPEDTEGN